MMVRAAKVVWLVALSAGVWARAEAATADIKAAERFKNEIRPILAAKCFACHGDGGDSGNVSFDLLESQGKLLGNIDVWNRALKNVRAGMMPPADADEKLTAAEKTTLEGFIKRDVFKLDDAQPDPGRVTLRRLNRFEYHNTVRDLLDVDFNVEDLFPTDDSGRGFDNIADVLTVSPMLLEKYISAAGQIVAKAVPASARTPAERWIAGGRFKDADGKSKDSDGRFALSYYSAGKGTYDVEFKQGGTYRLELTLAPTGRHSDGEAFDQNRAEAVFSMDGQEFFRREFGPRNGGGHEQEFTLNIGHWEPGNHTWTFEVNPAQLKGGAATKAATRAAEKATAQTAPPRIGENKLSLVSVRVVGPLEPGTWVPTKNHEKFFGKGEIPSDSAGRRALARKILTEFATRAFRRPVDSATVDRLVSLAESEYAQPETTFEAGVSQAMVAVLASPRFLFLSEQAVDSGDGGKYPQIDEYSLASRLSYFFWSSMPDPELIRLAAAGELRKNLAAQVKRLLGDGKASAFFTNFPGQWLQSRDVETVTLDKNEILGGRQAVKDRNLDDDNFGQVRSAMKQETERFFAYVVRENRSVLDFVDSDYTFLNQRLAEHYGVAGVTGKDVHRVELPADCFRGGVITMGTTLLVTSNPTRTSPVKRGLFLLDNILGTPTPPPPPNIPPLEASAHGGKGKTPTLRETLEMHRSKADCMSCHTRLDPPGLALESFDAVGLYRTLDHGEKIDSAGQLITGEKFKDVRELKKILVANHKDEIYRCLTEKLLTYALGRGMEYYDVGTIDQIVADLHRDEGKFGTLLNDVVNSAAFQRRREDGAGGGQPGAVSSLSEKVISEKVTP